MTAFQVVWAVALMITSNKIRFIKAKIAYNEKLCFDF